MLDVCGACKLSKAHILPLKHIHTKSFKPFTIIHVDLWSFAPIPSINEMKYFLLFVDDYTRFQWIYVIANKSQATSIFLHLEALVNM